MTQSWVGRTIGNRYQLEDLLGAGGMSAVYRAIDPNLRRVVAIKLIHPHLSVNPNFIDRFKEEAAAVAGLRHPNIVQVHDFSNEGDTYYMVMEYLAGETLQAHLRRIHAVGRHMPLRDVVRVGLQVCEAAGYAHRHDLVHRDIKPANIMLDVNGQAILMDFGIVKIVGGQYHTATGATLGTAVYMSPEQIRGERVDGRSDIYSIGVMLFEMLSGRPPYEADSALTLMMMHLNDPVPDPGQLRPDVPPELTAIITRALTKNHLDRYQTAEEMAEQLCQVETHLLLSAAKAEPASQSMTEQVELPVETYPVDQGQPPAIFELYGSETQPMEELESGPIIQPGTQPGTTNLTDLTDEPEVLSEAPVQQTEVADSTSINMEKSPLQLSESSQSQIESNLQFDKAAGSGRTRWVLPGIGLLILVLIMAAGGWFFIQRRPPNIQLMAIERPSTPINANSQGSLVNLGKWLSDSSIVELAFSPDSILLATASNRDWVRFSPFRFYASLWEVVPGRLYSNLTSHDEYMNSLAFSPDGLTVATGSDDGDIKFWKVADGQMESEIQSVSVGVTDLAFSPSGELIANGSWEGIALWQISNRNLLRMYKSHEEGILSIAFSPDGRLLAGGGEQGNIYLWQVSDGTLLHTMNSHAERINQVNFSPDSLALASASDDKTVILWQVNSGDMIFTLNGHTEGVSSVSFSQDGSLLASGGWDNTLRLWRAGDGIALQTIEINDSVNDLAFSPDGAWLAIATGEGQVNFMGISDVISYNLLTHKIP